MAAVKQPALTVGERWAIAALVLFIALIVLPLMMAFDVVPGLAPDKLPLVSVSYSKQPTGSNLTVALQPPPGIVLPDEDVKLALLLTNPGADSITVQSIVPSGDCLVLNQPLTPQPVVIPSRSTQQLPLEFHAACDSGQHPLTLLLKWTEAKSAGYEGFIGVSPITVVSKWAKGGQRFLRIDSVILKDFSLPIILVLLGAWIQNIVADRANRLKEEQDARESRNQILNTLLPNYVALVQEHYLAIARRLGTALDETRLYVDAIGNPAATPPADRALCSILLVRARILALFLKKGGIYFVSSVAEELFAACSDRFVETCSTVLNKDDFERGVALLETHVDDTFLSALDLCRGNAGFAVLVTRFQTWSNPDPASLRALQELLRVMGGVIAFECNRPFYQIGDGRSPADTQTRNWYVDPPTVDFKPHSFTVPADIATLLQRWYHGLPAECRL